MIHFRNTICDPSPHVHIRKWLSPCPHRSFVVAALRRINYIMRMKLEDLKNTMKCVKFIHGLKRASAWLYFNRWFLASINFKDIIPNFTLYQSMCIYIYMYKCTCRCICICICIFRISTDWDIYIYMYIYICIFSIWHGGSPTKNMLLRNVRFGNIRFQGFK